jgi:hypothetical protein
MSMRWKRLGKVFEPCGERPWMQTHAAVPVAEPLQGDLFKVYFSSRDAQGRSHTGFVVIDLRRPDVVLELSAAPVLSPGELGAFDDSGAMATWLVRHEGRSLLYYIGWNLGVTVPFRNAIGLAVARNGVDFVRVARGPIVDRTLDEPHFCASCCVVAEPQVWRMWYLSCTGWSLQAGKPMHHYHIKYAESDDGIHWRRHGKVAIDYRDDHETAISRPSVVHDADRWRMWYSCRGPAYRIGYAESDDGRAWRRLDHRAGLDVAASGWDSEMIEYPFVFDHGGQRFMLYNGNGYGRSGFGLAVQEAAR